MSEKKGECKMPGEGLEKGIYIENEWITVSWPKERGTL